MVIRISPRLLEVKADAVERVGKQHSGLRYGEWTGYHRGLRPGHVFKGVTRKSFGRLRTSFGRANCLLVGDEKGSGQAKQLKWLQ